MFIGLAPHDPQVCFIEVTATKGDARVGVPKGPCAVVQLQGEAGDLIVRVLPKGAYAGAVRILHALAVGYGKQMLPSRFKIAFHPGGIRRSLRLFHRSKPPRVRRRAGPEKHEAGDSDGGAYVHGRVP